MKVEETSKGVQTEKKAQSLSGSSRQLRWRPKSSLSPSRLPEAVPSKIDAQGAYELHFDGPQMNGKIIS